MASGGQRGYGNAGRSAYGGTTRGGQSRAVLTSADAASLTLTGALPTAANGSSAAFTPAIGGGRAPFTLSLAAGALPTGRVVSGLSVTGTYAGTGTFNYTLRVTDALGNKRDLALTTTVS